MRRSGMMTLSASAAIMALAASTLSAQGRGRGHDKNAPPPQIAHGEVARGRGGPPVEADEQRRRIEQERERATQYQHYLDERAREQAREQAQLQADRRAAQIRAQQVYNEQLARQRAEIRAERVYSNDPYVTAPHTYRYRMNGAYHLTNQYGADMLRRAVNYGYEQGVRAGAADRADRWRPNYANSPAYQEATYGYNGSYVDAADYMYYFRQGFQRGYDDGYYNRQQYGTYSNGSSSILSNILTSILGLTTIR